mgnify:FL=1
MPADQVEEFGAVLGHALTHADHARHRPSQKGHGLPSLTLSNHRAMSRHRGAAVYPTPLQNADRVPQIHVRAPHLRRYAGYRVRSVVVLAGPVIATVSPGGTPSALEPPKLAQESL